MRSVCALICCSVLCAALPATAKPKPLSPITSPTEAALPAPTGEQVEISADDSLEWYQDKRLYVARGNAKASRGSLSVSADLLTAHQKDKGDDVSPPASPQEASSPPATAKTSDNPANAMGDIDLLTAEGHVVIADARQQVFGDKAVYDLNRKIATVTGKDLKYVSDHDVVTARDALEFDENKNMAIARGQAKAVHEQRRVEADSLAARFTQNAAGQMEMTEMIAEGHVAVVTNNDISRGDKAVYDVKRNVAVMTGHVRVTRGDTQLMGDRAEVDLTKGESRLVNQGKGKRVRALLTPKTMNAPGPKTETNPPLDTDAKTGQKTPPKATAP